MTTASGQPGFSPLFLGDDLALDFINSAYGVGEAHRDHLSDAQGTLAWFAAAGLPLPALAGADLATMHAEAVALRDDARDLVRRRKRGERGDPSTLNRLLALGNACRELSWPDADAPSLRTIERADDPRAMLLPVAGAIATLLSTANFELVRECESDDCTLWFHDHTRSHHRRWCSQATCGNRMKVAAFRARKRG
ncbi:MAG: CGNR zinc finger domain-containing protein [Luteibacter sp.]